MKVPHAALMAVLGAATSCHAFVPNAKFAKNVAAFSRPSSIYSTTIKEDELFHELDRNGALQSEIAEMMGASPSIGAQKPAKSREVLEAEAEISTRADIKNMLKRYEGLSGAAIVYLKLLEHGVEVVNGYSGGAVLPLVDQFHPDNPRHAEIGAEPIRWITNSNEASAGHIAEGYAKSYPINGEQ